MRVVRVVLILLVLILGACFSEGPTDVERRASAGAGSVTLRFCPIYFNHANGAVDTVPCSRSAD